MWIASELGFFSIVCKDAGWHVRARVRGDLANLLAATGIKEEIQEWPAADYRFRVILVKRDLTKVYKALESSVAYPNFKSRIAELPDQRAKLTAYHNLWADLMTLQRDF